MENILEQLAVCIERGKVNKAAKYPTDLQDQEGADELTKKALEASFSADEILKKALMVGMQRVGDRFGSGKAYVPDLLIAAKAMQAAMIHLKPFFESGEVRHQGTVVLGTVSGDLHDIGKNIVKMVLKGSGWKVIDLGVDASSSQFLEAIAENPGCYVGMSALLTTTMMNMKTTNRDIKEKYPGTKVFVGGAPLSQAFSDEIDADGYFSEPYGFAKHLNGLVQ